VNEHSQFVADRFYPDNLYHFKVASRAPRGSTLHRQHRSAPLNRDLVGQKSIGKQRQRCIVPPKLPVSEVAYLSLRAENDEMRHDGVSMLLRRVEQWAEEVLP
jgi:hypothetical protein